MPATADATGSQGRTVAVETPAHMARHDEAARAFALPREDCPLGFWRPG